MAYDDQQMMDPGTEPDMAPEDTQEAPGPRELLQTYLGMANIANLGDESLEANSGTEDTPGLNLASIGAQVIRDYRYDKASRADWEERNEQGLKLARQMKDGRRYAGEPIADVKYPTIAAAAIQYASRAYPAIVKEGEVVKYRPIGADPDGQKAARGARVAQYMNWQILADMETWDEDMDRLLFLQPIVGVYYKKTYYDPQTGKPCSELVSPEDLVMYYDSTSFVRCPRRTHIIYLTHNEYLEGVRAGTYSDVESITRPDTEQDGGLHTFLEQHRTLDLDGDGYEEPYIVTVDEKTEAVVRIVCRFTANDITPGQQDEIGRIQPTEHFTEFLFMPSFDGGIYGMGFGILLGPLNESINTLFNQILDAGTRSNFQGGFIGKGTRLLRGGEAGSLQFKRGEWKFIQAPGDDLRKAIVPLPATEPSAVLFQLLGFLVAAAEKLAAQSDLLAGVQEQHNVPATSTMALMEQGLKVLSGIYKRDYRALRKEFGKIRVYVAQRITPEQYVNIVDDPKADIQDFVIQDHDIMPMSTAAEMTEAQMYLKAQAMMAMKGQGLDDMEINRFYMEALGIPDVQRFLPKQPPPPPPQFIIAMRQLDLEEQKLQLEFIRVQITDNEVAAKIREMRERAVKLRADAMAALAKAEAAEEGGSQLQEYEERMVGLLGQIFELEQLEESRRALSRQPAPASPPQPAGPAPAPGPMPTGGPQGPMPGPGGV